MEEQAFRSRSKPLTGRRAKGLPNRAFQPGRRKVHYCLAVSQTSASASPENNRQPEQDDCDRHKRRAGDVSDQDEDDRDDGEDCWDVVVHSFLACVADATV